MVMIVTAFDGYSRRGFGALVHDFVFFRLMLCLESLTHIRESVEKGLELVFTLCYNGNIVREEKVALHYSANFGLCSKACRVEEFSIKLEYVIGCLHQLT